jgi:hypothetical protein
LDLCAYLPPTSSRLAVIKGLSRSAIRDDGHNPLPVFPVSASGHHLLRAFFNALVGVKGLKATGTTLESSPVNKDSTLGGIDEFKSNSAAHRCFPVLGTEFPMPKPEWTDS